MSSLDNHGWETRQMQNSKIAKWQNCFAILLFCILLFHFFVTEFLHKFLWMNLL